MMGTLLIINNYSDSLNQLSGWGWGDACTSKHDNIKEKVNNWEMVELIKSTIEWE